jgi:hypothetical protein
LPEDSTTIRKYIRHPSDVPIRVTLDLVEDDSDDLEDQTLTNLSLGGLSFISTQPLKTGQKASVCIPVLKQDNCLAGTVVWCEKSKNGYEIGVEFEGSKDVFRLRMIEQICHIEHYRKEVKLVEGRELSSEEAATEWIKRYAGDFPA